MVRSNGWRIELSAVSDVDDVVIGPLPDEVASLDFLLGTWVGGGLGGYPTMDPFVYGERAGRNRAR